MSELKAAETLKINELRCGNWVQYDDGPTPAKIHSLNLYRKEIGLERFPQPLSPSVILPIPLSEDILLKAGFEKNDWTQEGKIIYKGWAYDGVMIGADFKLDGYDFEPIKYLHQLQNLVYILTGEELTLQL